MVSFGRVLEGELGLEEAFGLSQKGRPRSDLAREPLRQVKGMHELRPRVCNYLGLSSSKKVTAGHS